MAAFGAGSERQLAGVHEGLVGVCREAIKIMDFTVLQGVRSVEQQAANIVSGVSWTKNSKHLLQADGTGHAVDLAPFRPNLQINWKDVEMFCVLAGVMRACAHYRGVRLRWGGDWDSDDSTTDELHRDYGHFELAGLP